MLPHVEFEYKKYLQLPSVKTSVFDIKVRIVEVLLQALRVNAGFQLPTVSMLLDKKNYCTNMSCLILFFSVFCRRDAA